MSNEPLVLLKNLVSNDLNKVNKLIMEFAKGKSTELIDIVSKHITSSGGKRLRPMLTLIAAKLFNTQNAQNHVFLATAVEFIHTATLLHDDVIDESKTRRGVATANNVWGNKSSILVGDYLFSQAFKLMVKTKSITVLEVLSTASAIISEGEIEELQLLGNADISIKDYIKLITAKTAVLFSSACKVGAIVSNAHQDQIKALRDYGLNLGICFQIADDILDYFAQDVQFGKKIGNDFCEGKITLPLIMAYTDNKHIKNQIIDLLLKSDKSENDFLKIQALLKQSNVEQKIQELSNHYIDQGIKALHLFPDSEIKNVLVNLIKFSITRTF